MTEAIALGIAGEVRPPTTFAQEVLLLARRLAAFPREAYAHSKAALVAEAVARIEAETPDEAFATMSVWITDESREARRRQREKLKAGG
jgi:hypothetical protein